MAKLLHSERRPGGWRIGDRELHDGDLIEIDKDSRWHVARYEYDWQTREYRLMLDGKGFTIVEDTQARMFA